jgi:hypothetical protein
MQRFSEVLRTAWWVSAVMCGVVPRSNERELHIQTLTALSTLLRYQKKYINTKPLNRAFWRYAWLPLKISNSVVILAVDGLTAHTRILHTRQAIQTHPNRDLRQPQKCLINRLSYVMSVIRLRRVLTQFPSTAHVHRLQTAGNGTAWAKLLQIMYESHLRNTRGSGFPMVPLKLRSDEYSRVCHL